MEAQLTNEAGQTERYKQFICRYKACKYEEKTWGWIIANDYAHFANLMMYNVPLGSPTWDALSGALTQDNYKAGQATTRQHDTDEYKKAQATQYLDYTCQHNGKHNGKTWATIKAGDYPYFRWSVANAMGRETQTYKVFHALLKPKDQANIDSFKTSKVAKARVVS